jgi:hypothetical protein
MPQRAKQQFGGAFFMEIFMLGSWLIWKQRNDVILNRGGATFTGGSEDSLMKLPCKPTASIQNCLFYFYVKLVEIVPWLA